MDKISASEASELLGISIHEIKVLEKQGLLHSVANKEGLELYSPSEISEIKLRQGLTISEEAVQVDAQLQRDMTISISTTRKILLVVGGVLAGYAFLIIIFAALFAIYPLQTARWVGIIRESTNSDLLSLNGGRNNVLGAETSRIGEFNSVVQSALQPIAKVSLGLVKTINPNSYSQVSSAVILDPNDVLSVDANGVIVPIRPIKLPESSYLQISNDQLVANLNSQYIQGREPGTNVGDLAIVGDEVKETLIPAVTGLTNSNLSGSAGITNDNLENSNLTIDTLGPIAGGGSVSLGGKITITCPTCIVGTSTFTSSSTDTLTNKTIAAGSNTLTGLTNSNLSGSAGITNVNLANSSIGLLGNSGSGSVSLGGNLTLTGTGITSIAATGSIFTLTSTEADTLSSVVNRGALTSTTLTLDGGIITTTSTPLNMDSGTTGAINLGTGANAKTLNIGNLSGATAINLNSGTGNINFTVDGTGSSGRVQIGSSGTSTPDLLVLDNGTADPTGVNGGMYYNTSINKFRCYENNAWANCISSGSSSSSDLQHAALYDTSEALTNVPTGGGQTVLGTISVTPTSATGDVYVNGWTDVYSNSGTDQPFNLVIETSTNCTGSIVGNANVTYTITSGASAVNDRGSLRISGIAVDPGASSQTYSLCAAVSSGVGNTDVLNWGIEAVVVDTGADYAEIYTTNDESIMPGDVVSFDSSLKTGIKKSLIAYDSNVLGVVSTKPGMLVGSVDKEGIGAMPVALSGRVPVKVSTQNGPILVGDYLTSSSIPGVAMKATLSGTIIGTAISSFDEDGVGQVIMFVKNDSAGGNNINTESYTNSISVDDKTISTQVVKIISDFFKNMVEFFGKVIFHSDVSLLGHTTLGKDSAGQIVIKSGVNEVSVNFDKEYINNPAVTISVILADPNKFEEIPGYAVYDLNRDGFKIKLSKPSSIDLYFSWIALETIDGEFIKPVDMPIENFLVTPSPIPTLSPNVEEVLSPEDPPTP